MSRVLPLIGVIVCAVCAVITALGPTSQAGEIVAWLTAAMWALNTLLAEMKDRS